MIIYSVHNFTHDIAHAKISQEEWLEVRADFSAKTKSSQGQVVKEEAEESIMPQGFEFLADKVIISED